MKLVARLATDYPQFTWVKSDIAHWSAREQTIYCNDDDIQTLHELGHALLGHDHYNQDIELLHIERAAWEKAQELAPHYELSIDDEVVEDALDSYRDWLHIRSKCPKCGMTGLQSATDGHYYCPTCQTKWFASEGKQRQMRRMQI